MSTVPTYVLGDTQLFLEGARCLLAHTPYKVEGLGKTLADIDRAGTGEAEPTLLIFAMLTSGSLDEVKVARRRFPQSRIVVLTGTADSEHFSACLEAGVDGYLLASITSEVFVECLRLVMLGERVFPTILSTWLLERRSFLPSQPQAMEEQVLLSNRELEILPLLIQGVSNKEIARQLGIADATVKIHVRRLFKKVKASNRTQAVVWALNNGLHEQYTTT